MPLYNPNLTHQIAGNTAGATANIATGTYQLAGGNNITLSQNANSVTISAGGGGAGDGYNILGVNGAGTSASTTLQLSNANNVSFGLNAGTITATASFNQSVQTQNMVSVEGSTGNIDFANANGITFGFNASTITASHNGLTSQSNQAASGSNGSFTFQTLSFNNANGISFGSNGSAITASHNALTTARASNDAIGLNTAQSNVTWTANSAGLSLDARGYAGTGTTFNGANISASLTQNSNGIQISASVAAPGAAAENNWFELAGNDVGNTTASGSTIQLIGGNNITLSGTNGSQIQIDGPAILSGFEPYQDQFLNTIATSQGTLSLNPVYIPAVQFDRLAFFMNNTNSSNSSGSHSITARFGIYTQNGSTLSLLHSASTSMALTHSGTAGSYSLYSGMRMVTVGLTQTLTGGKYWLAGVSSTSSGGANGSYSMFGLSQLNSNFLGHFSSSHNTTYQMTLGQGIYTAATNGMPASIGFSQIRGSDSNGYRQPYLLMISSTV